MIRIDFVQDHTTVIERVDDIVVVITICPNDDLITSEYLVDELLYLTETIEDDGKETVNTYVMARIHSNVLHKLRKRGVDC